MILLLPLLVVAAIVLYTVLQWPAVADQPPQPCGPCVSILIPARDEAHNIPACLESLKSQPCVNEILVYDDHSTDGTSAAVESVAAHHPEIRLIPTRPLPANWCGKNHACAELATRASSQWLLFLDADARLSPHAIPAMLNEAWCREATLLSCWPALEMKTFVEQLLMPMLNFVVFSFYPAPLGLRRNHPSLGIAHGACILAHKATYESVGGHASVASEIFEDTRLARLWRERGHRSLCLDGQDVVRVRMYATASEIWTGFQKNFRPGFKTSASFWTFLAAHAILFLLPFAVSWPAAAVVIAIRLLLALRFHHPLWSALLHPFAELFLLALGISSWWQVRTGRGLLWKGRRYSHP